MDVPQHHQPQHHQYQSKSTRNSYTIDAQISHPVTHLNNSFPELHHHNLGVPPFHIPGFSPYPIGAQDVGDAGVDLPWFFPESEPKKKKLKEKDFWENNSKSSVVDFLQLRSVSTGLGLSLDRTGVVSLGDSPSLSFIGDEIDREFHDLEASIDKFLKIQGEEMRRAVEEGVRRAMGAVEERAKRKIREKEMEVTAINKKNIELEKEAEQLWGEVDQWRQQSHYYDQMIAAMNLALHRFSTSPPWQQPEKGGWDDGREDEDEDEEEEGEGCGDNTDQGDSTSCSNPPPPFSRTPSSSLSCKHCCSRQARMLLLPCHHLCLCRNCEPFLSSCPLCHSFKLLSMEVFL